MQTDFLVKMLVHVSVIIVFKHLLVNFRKIFNQIHNSQNMKFLIIVFFHRNYKQFSSLAFYILCMNGIFFTLLLIAGFSIIQTILLNTDSDCFKVNSFQLALTLKEARYHPLKSSTCTQYD